MNMKRIRPNFVTILLLFSFSSVSIIDVVTEPSVRKVGVKVGDWAKYGEFKVTWNSNDINAKPDQELIDANKTTWIHISVHTITSKRISFQEKTRFTNGTEKSTSKEVDVDSGWGNGAFTFISADLNDNDSLYSSEEGALLKINETISRTYVGVSRETNALNLTSRMIQGDPPQVINVSILYLWDRTTGIIAERKASAVNKTGNYVASWSRSDKIIDTNLWDGTQAVNGETPYWIIGTMTLFLVIIGGLGFWLQRRSRSKVDRRRRCRRQAHFHAFCSRNS